MASGHQMNGMLGVYLTAAELTSRGFIVSLTSRNAFGADLLATDQKCRRAWSVQVKTKNSKNTYWLLSPAAAKLKSESHLYVFVHLKGDSRPDYLVVPSTIVARKMTTYVRQNSTWYAFPRTAIQSNEEGWEIFGKAA
jgi:hypothetical protein